MDVTDLIMLAIAVVCFGVGLFLYWLPPVNPEAVGLERNNSSRTPLQRACRHPKQAQC